MFVAGGVALSPSKCERGDGPERAASQRARLLVRLFEYQVAVEVQLRQPNHPFPDAGADDRSVRVPDELANAEIPEDCPLGRADSCEAFFF